MSALCASESAGLSQANSPTSLHVSQRAPHPLSRLRDFKWCHPHHVGCRRNRNSHFSCHPFACGLLKGQRPPPRGPATAGSATYHGLCPARSVQVARAEAPGKALGDQDLEPRNGRCRHCLHLQVVPVGMGFGFLAVTASSGFAQGPQMDILMPRSQLLLKGFQSLKEGVAVELTFKKSPPDWNLFVSRPWWGMLYWE